MSRHAVLCRRLDELNAEYIKALMIPLTRDRIQAFLAIKEQADEVYAELKQLASRAQVSPDHSQYEVLNDRTQPDQAATSLAEFRSPPHFEMFRSGDVS